MNNKVEQKKRVWEKPQLEVVSVRETAYWEFRWNEKTGFWENVWVSES
ncbi:hypothetical protein GQF01_26275 [Paenibacillus sp. 5J-6]|uniref:Uncharacterized protein n=1 Tax=Paenibacillus silvestris TaxID=2606219 RepID=A0A6L8V5J9_9BACL|nr:hypothetical protein [Paenibacillus silvestris]MZQ85633.1 hypothetical protein [Paenibacillus silvestris]